LTALVARKRPVRPALPRSTPGRIFSVATAAVVLACCLAAVIAVAFGGLGGDFQSTGQRDAPEVNATTGLYFSLNDMDAQVANVLPAVASLTSVSAAELDATYQRGRTTALTGIIVVTVTGLAVLAVLVALQAYLAAVSYDANADESRYLGAEFRNITFPGERAAAVRTLLAYPVYERYDRVLRALAKRNLAAAVAFDIGTAPGQSDWAFNQYDAALSSVISINQDAFTSAVQAGQGGAGGWNGAVPAAAAAAIAALTIIGVWPRIAEYH
jgi:hypothetical protein